MLTYLLIGTSTIPIFFYIENKWPAPEFKHNYPHGKPYLWWFCWVAALTFVLLWPIFYLAALPEMIIDKNGNAPHCNPLANNKEPEYYI